MLLTTETIQRIRDVAITDVIGHYIKLVRSGSNVKGCCPFHNERTPSFTVSESREIFKCFGCGISGDAITFVMEHEKQTFLEACKTIAANHHIAVEYEHREIAEEEKERLSAAELQEKVLNFVIPIYKRELQQLPEDHQAKVWLRDRGLTDEAIEDWEIGWAPEEWRFVTPRLIEMNWYDPATKVGIIRSKESNHWDGYRSRLIFPITDQNGRYIGLGGRYIDVDGKGSCDVPKYINPNECDLYRKSNVFFGLKQAHKAIRKTGAACITEGYMDVITPHVHGQKNVISTCGTALTDDHIRILKKHTESVVLWRDNDEAGINATVKQLPQLLRKGFDVQVMQYGQKDPDEYFRSLAAGEVEEAQPVDGVLWYARRTWTGVENIRERVTAKKGILDVIATMQSEMLRNNWLDMVITELGWKPSETKREFKQIVDKVSYAEDDEAPAAEEQKFPAWLLEEQQEEVLKCGYATINRTEKGKPMVGYYSFTPSGGKVEITNFIIKPLFHVYAGQDSRYFLQIDNGYNKAVLDVPAKVIPSTDQFQGITVTEGAFMIYGGKNQWLRICSDLLRRFPRCLEITSLGWQPAGFYAFVDKVFVPGTGTRDLDNWGMFSHAEQRYLIPASSEAYMQLKNTSNDVFANDRHLSFRQAPVTFSRWARQMERVYLQKGIVGVAYAILTLFRDIVFDVDNNCPHLYGYGEPSSGKSKWAESITAIFYYRRAAFNLNSGTDFAFFQYNQRYVNAPSHLNEFDIEVIRMEWFQAIKGIYDGEGRERGKMNGPKNRTEVMHVKSTLIITGQKLVTADDNSVVTRSLIEPFSVREDLTDTDKNMYDELKEWESSGLSSILLEVLACRKIFEQQYKERFNLQLSHWRKTKSETKGLNQRILQNYAHLLTCYRIVSEHIDLPQPVAEFEEYCFAKAKQWSSFIRSSDTLSEFWRTVEFLVNQHDLVDGWDFIVEECTSVRIRKNRDEEYEHAFDKPTKVLFLRLNNAHKLFQKEYRSRTGKEAMSIENMLHYFGSRKYFVGSMKQKKFTRYEYETETVAKPFSPGETMAQTTKKQKQQVTSCYCFVYEDLDISIVSNEVSDGATDRPANAAAPAGFIPQTDIPFPNPPGAFGNR